MVEKVLERTEGLKSARFKIWSAKSYSGVPEGERVMSVSDLIYEIKIVKAADRIKFTIVPEWFNKEQLIIELSSNYNIVDNNFNAAFKPVARISVKLFGTTGEIQFKQQGIGTYYSEFEISENKLLLKLAANIIKGEDGDLIKSLIPAIDLYTQQLLERLPELGRSEHLMRIGLYRLSLTNRLKTAITNANNQDSGLSISEEQPEVAGISLRE